MSAGAAASRVTPAVSDMLARMVADLAAAGVDPDGERVYLLHFARPYHHAQHYLGWSPRLMRRLLAHVTGHGSPLVAAAVGAGIAVTLARTWPGGRAVERALKRRKRHRAFCPLCAGARPAAIGQGR
jgi:hypothetical protein